MKMQPLVSVIIPTRNSVKNLAIFFTSCLDSDFKNFEIIINDDLASADNTEEMIRSFQTKGLKIMYLKQNKSMAQGRKRGAEFTSGQYFFFLDSDMKITPGLLSECIEGMNKGYDALIVPEESYGTTFWARCKWLEKRCYNGIDKIESLRFVKKDIYWKVGGHNEEMVFSEDKDLDIRVRKTGCRMGRVVNNFLWHNEGDLYLIKTMKKKLGYSNTANTFATIHPEHFKWQINIFHRYVIYLKNIKYLLSHPLLYIGMIYMKTMEFGAGAIGLVYSKLHKYVVSFYIF